MLFAALCSADLPVPVTADLANVYYAICELEFGYHYFASKRTFHCRGRLGLGEDVRNYTLENLSTVPYMEANRRRYFPLPAERTPTTLFELYPIQLK
jgi:hypothetical protein